LTKTSPASFITLLTIPTSSANLPPFSPTMTGSVSCFLSTINGSPPNNSATFSSVIALIPFALSRSFPSSEEINAERTKNRTESYAPRWWNAWRGARKEEPRLRRERTERRLSSERALGKERGREVAVPCCWERRT
jgi:hypothetical protein